MLSQSSNVTDRGAGTEKPISIGMHGKDFDALDRKRWVDDVIVMVWAGARILRASNALWIFTIACVAEEQEWKN